jgi:membrane protease subunit HflC
VILLLGDPRRVTQPGVALRIPLLETVRSYERRLLYLNAPPNSITTRDQETLVVDNYVAWRIADPVQFAAAFPAGRSAAEPQIDQVVRSAVREVVGQHTLADVLTGRRGEIMLTITEKTKLALAKFGIALEDVRINRTELPKGTEENVFARMKAERETQARKFRAEGGERARRIRAEADREARVIVANAQRDAEIARGVGDAEAARIYAEAYGANPKLYAFVRSLEAYRKTLGEHTTLVLSPKSEFFRFLDRPAPETRGEAGR